MNFLTQDITRPSIESLSDSDASLDMYNEVEELDQSYFTRLSNILRFSEGRSLFCDLLEGVKHRHCLSEDKLMKLAAIVTSLLTVIMMDNDNDPVVFCKIVVLSHAFYTERADSRRLYLSNFVMSHAI